MPKKVPKIVREIQKNRPEKLNYAFQKNITFLMYFISQFFHNT